MPSAQHAVQILDRRRDVATRYLQGETQHTIAQAHSVSQAQISGDLKIIRAAWLASSLRDFDAAKAEELARIDAVEREAWAAWKRTQQPREVTVQESNDGKLKAVRRLEGQAGDPRFLDTVLKCVERRCTILGLEAARKFQFDWDTATEEQLTRLARGEPLLAVLAAPTHSLAEA